MELSEFIASNKEAIADECEAFARSIQPAAGSLDSKALRDHAVQMLEAISADMATAQTGKQQSEKSRGEAPRAASSPPTAAEQHGDSRSEHGFNVDQTVSEFRALRATVIRLWLASAPPLGALQIDELVRFNEAMDQALAESLQRFAQAAARDRNLFLGVLSHELRTPLTTIVVSAQSLLKAADQRTLLPDALHRTLRSGKRIESVLNDLLDFVRSGVSGGMRVTPTAVDMNRLCEKVAGDMRASFPQGRLQVRTKGDVAGRWDENRIAQALTNLISNAIKYGQQDAPVVVSASEGVDGDVVVRVCNQGPEISAATLESLFQPLVRGVGPDESDLSLGVGLYIVREIALAHGGTATATSSTAEGTVFTLRLPKDSETHLSSAFGNLGMH